MPSRVEHLSHARGLRPYLTMVLVFLFLINWDGEHLFKDISIILTSLWSICSDFFFFGPFLSWFILSYRVIAVLRVLHFGGTSPCSDICTVNIFFHCVAIFFPFCMSFLLRSRSFPFDEFQLVHIFLLSLVLCYSRPNESLVLRSHEHFLPEIL